MSSTLKRWSDHYFFNIGFVLITIFPLLGNAASVLGFPPRRTSQLLFLLFGLSFIFLWIYQKREVLWNRLCEKTNFRKLKISLGLGLLVTIPLIGKAFFRGLTTSSSEWMTLFLIFFYFFVFCWSCLFWISANREFEEDTNPQLLPESQTLRFTLIVYGWGVAIIAWLSGPVENEALMSLGGSNIVLAGQAAIGLFSALFIFSGLTRLVAALPFAYMLFFSTARTGTVLFFVLFIIYAARETLKIAKKNQGFCTTLLKIAQPLLLILALILPLAKDSHFYPYFDPSANEVLLKTRRVEFASRYARLVRVAPFDAQNLYDKFLSLSQWVRKEDLSALPRCVDAQCTASQAIKIWYKTPEMRFSLVNKSIEAILQSPFGYWPNRFEDAVPISCEEKQRCRYAHNLVIDVFFNLGWLSGLIFVLLALTLMATLSRRLVQTDEPVEIFVAIVGIVALVVSQFSGTFSDYLHLFTVLGLLSLWKLAGSEHYVR